MIKRINQAFDQIRFLVFETKKMNNVRWWRWGSCWFSTSFWAVASYRFDRFFFLLFGKAWSAIRIVLSPLFFILRPWFGRCEIHYRAEIGKGLSVLHPSLGAVISGNAVIGENLSLVGGNCIGGRRKLNRGDLVIGSNVNLGANAVILGPVKVGSNINIGAGAVVVKDIENDKTVAGVPALPIN